MDDRVFMMLPRDMANYLAEYLNINDIKNMLRAGHYLKIFVKHFYLKNNCIIKFTIKKEFIRNFIDLVEYIDDNFQQGKEHYTNYPTGLRDISFNKNGLQMNGISNGNNVIFNLEIKRHFFKYYWIPASNNITIDYEKLSSILSELKKRRMDDLSIGIDIDDSKTIIIESNKYDQNMVIINRIPLTYKFYTPKNSNAFLIHNKNYYLYSYSYRVDNIYYDILINNLSKNRTTRFVHDHDTLKIKLKTITNDNIDETIVIKRNMDKNIEPFITNICLHVNLNNMPMFSNNFIFSFGKEFVDITDKNDEIGYTMHLMSTILKP